MIFRGSSSPSECLTIISNFLRLSYDTCYPKPCAIGSIYQPSVGSDIFYAVAVFAFVASDLKATDSSGRLDIDKLNKTAHIYCSKVRQHGIFFVLIDNKMNEDFKHFNLPWYPLVRFTSLFSMKTIDDAASVYNVPPEFGSNTCMMALYITELLTFSYGFPVNTKRIYSFKDINGKSLSKIKRTFVIMKKNLIYKMYNINWYICRSFHPLASVCKIVWHLLCHVCKLFYHIKAKQIFN